MRVCALSHLYLTIRFYIYNCIQRFILQIYVFPYLMRSDCMIICVRYDTYTLHNYICIAINLVDQENCHEMVQPLAETHRPFVGHKVIKFVICDLKYHLSDHKMHVNDPFFHMCWNMKPHILEHKTSFWHDVLSS